MRKLIKKLRSYIIPMLLLFACNGMWAQSKVDSLLQARNVAVHDSVKVMIDMTLGKSFRVSDPDSSAFYGKRALNLARKATMKEYPEFEYKAMIELGLAYGYSKDHKRKAISYIRETIPFYLEKKDLEQLVYNYFSIGYFYGSQLYEYDSAVYYYNRAINVGGSPTSRYFGSSYNNGGLAYYYLGDYQKAIEYGTEAVQIRKENGSAYQVACSILNVGMAYEKLTQLDDAKLYYNLALDGFVKAGHTPNQAVSYKNLAEVLIAQDSLKKALEYYDKAGQLFAKVKSFNMVSDCFVNISAIYLKTGEYQKAQDFLLNAEATVPNLASDRSKSQIYSSLAKTKKILADSVYNSEAIKRLSTLKEGAVFGEKAWNYAESSNSIEVKVIAARNLMHIYDDLKNYERGFHYAKLLNEVNIASSKRIQSDAMARMATEFETDRIESDNALLKESQKAQAARLKQQNYLIYGIAIALLFIVVIVIIVYRSRKRLQKANGIVEKSLSEKELLLKEIHHRVKNNLQVVSSLLELQSLGIEDEKALSTFKEGQNRVKAMALIHQKLYQNEDLASINVVQYAEQLSSELANIYPDSGKVTTSIRGSSKMDFDIDTAVPLGLILNELISNTYKYAFDGKDNGQLQVSFESVGEGKHQLVVEDNGHGLPEAFDLNKVKSLGLRLVSRLAEQLYGKVEYYGSHGAKFVISFEESIKRVPS